MSPRLPTLESERKPLVSVRNSWQYSFHVLCMASNHKQGVPKVAQVADKSDRVADKPFPGAPS